MQKWNEWQHATARCRYAHRVLANITYQPKLVPFDFAFRNAVIENNEDDEDDGDD